jgi:hypothetical protein
VITKFFLHIDKKEQKRRFQELEKDPLRSWHVQPEDWEHHRKYQEYLVAIEEMLERTDTEWGPWTIVEATDRRWARVKIFETLIQRLEEALTERGFELPEQELRPDTDDEGEAQPKVEAEPPLESASAADEDLDSEGLEAELAAEAEAQAGEA